MKNRSAQRGSAIIEMTLIGIPIIFVLISTFEMARGMWIYHTLSYAAREGTRYVIVHGTNCQPTVPSPPVGTNICGISQKDLYTFLNNAVTGLTQDSVKVAFTSGCAAGSATTCGDSFGVAAVCTLGTSGGQSLQAGNCTNAGTCSCSSSCSYIPRCSGNAVGQPITLRLQYPFRSAIAMFWPGAGRGRVFQPVTFTAFSQDYIQF